MEVEEGEDRKSIERFFIYLGAVTEDGILRKVGSIRE